MVLFALRKDLAQLPVDLRLHIQRIATAPKIIQQRVGDAHQAVIVDADVLRLTVFLILMPVIGA